MNTSADHNNFHLSCILYRDDLRSNDSKQKKDIKVAKKSAEKDKLFCDPTRKMFTSQVDVNGKNAAPVWTWLKEQEGGLLGSGIKWNFTKFVVDGEGKAVARIGPMSDPIPAVQTEVEKLIGKPGQ